ncbi:hypothetical protein [Streptomyces sp. NPDC056144]|uniref:hypothetical protein n=1 Tax=unclassified Streptomyces TaxID=2593676 RepID=UPI0035E00A85
MTSLRHAPPVGKRGGVGRAKAPSVPAPEDHRETPVTATSAHHLGRIPIPRQQARADAPLTSEPPLPDAAPLTSEPPLTGAAPLTSEPTARGSAEPPGV